MSVSFTDGNDPCTGSVGSMSSRSFSTFSRVSTDSLHLALISSSSRRIVSDIHRKDSVLLVQAH